MFHLTFKKSSVSKKLIGKSSRFQELANTRCMRTERPGSKTLFKKQAQDRMEKPIITLLWAGPLLSLDPASKLSVSNNSGRIAPSSQAVENQVCISRAAWVGSSLLGINWVTCPHPLTSLVVSSFLQIQPCSFLSCWREVLEWVGSQDDPIEFRPRIIL